MLRIKLTLATEYDEETNKFDDVEIYELDFEHSLVSLSKWEAKYEKPFIGNADKTREEVVDYIRMMVIGEIPPEKIFDQLSDKDIQSITQYIDAKMTATWFSKSAKPTSKEIITTELIYYWMIALSIPFECENWHFNRLLTLIRVCNEKNNTQPDKKLGVQDLAERKRLNDERRRQLGTSG